MENMGTMGTMGAMGPMWRLCRKKYHEFDGFAIRVNQQQIPGFSGDIVATYLP